MFSGHFSKDARRNTNKVLEMVDEGMLDKDTMLQMCLEWLSDADVEEMCRRNDIFLDEDDEAEEWDMSGTEQDCPECGEGPYPLTFTECPECGATFEEDDE